MYIVFLCVAHRCTRQHIVLQNLYIAKECEGMGEKAR